MSKARDPISMTPKGLMSQESISHFFNQEINAGLNSQSIILQDFTKSYLVKLLTDYAHAETFFQDKEQESLATLYLKSQQVNKEERVRLLRRLGDLSLCVSGLF